MTPPQRIPSSYSKALPPEASKKVFMTPWAPTVEKVFTPENGWSTWCIGCRVKPDQFGKCSCKLPEGEIPIVTVSPHAPDPESTDRFGNKLPPVMAFPTMTAVIHPPTTQQENAASDKGNNNSSHNPRDGQNNNGRGPPDDAGDGAGGGGKGNGDDKSTGGSSDRRKERKEKERKEKNEEWKK
jgi:hypothetical protein